MGFTLQQGVLSLVSLGFVAPQPPEHQKHQCQQEHADRANNVGLLAPLGQGAFLGNAHDQIERVALPVVDPKEAVNVKDALCAIGLRPYVHIKVGQTRLHTLHDGVATETLVGVLDCAPDV